jgi:hypothetical protein
MNGIASHPISIELGSIITSENFLDYFDPQSEKQATLDHFAKQRGYNSFPEMVKLEAPEIMERFRPIKYE